LERKGLFLVSLFSSVCVRYTIIVRFYWGLFHDPSYLFIL
jgi:hypothetical protein